MFAVEIVAGVAAHSAALKADALDFLGDSANYAISLGVAGMALQWRGRAALLKGTSLLLLGLWILGSTVWMAMTGALRSEEHTSELQSLMRISYAVFCLKKKTKTQTEIATTQTHPSHN